MWSFYKCTGKGKAIFLLICFHESGVRSFPKPFLSSDQNLITSNSSVIMLPIWLSHHLCTSSPHFSLLSQTKLSALRTLTRLCEQVPVNSLLDPLTRVKELQNDFMDSSALCQAELSKAFSLQLYHLWRILINTFSYLTMHIRSLSLLETIHFTITLQDIVFNVDWTHHGR